MKWYGLNLGNRARFVLRWTILSGAGMLQK